MKLKMGDPVRLSASCLARNNWKDDGLRGKVDRIEERNRGEALVWVRWFSQPRWGGSQDATHYESSLELDGAPDPFLLKVQSYLDKELRR